VHQPQVDPNFLNMSARDAQELKKKATKAPGKALSARKEALQRYIQEAKALASEGTASSFEKKAVQLLEEKAAANDALWSIYNGQGGEDKEKAFFAVSSRTWTEEIPKALNVAEEVVKGPFVLGDQIVRGCGPAG
jgi:hypothetical protein